MEEAFMQLYDQYVQLRALCLRQAELLSRISASRDLHNGLLTKDADMKTPTSLPVQCSDVGHGCSKRAFPQPGAPLSRSPAPGFVAAAPPYAQHPAAMAESSTLTNGVKALEIHPPERKGHPTSAGPSCLCEGSRTQEPLGCPGGGGTWQSAPEKPSEDHLMQREAEKTQHGSPNQTHWTPGYHLDSDLLSRGGLLLSDITLNSQVCEFCQAVFPSDTTTRGEYLRHITAHIT
ncbi:uncharacterized protein zgc:113184 [Erpetoichthys calabaricus]|uniref:uncharacterized protein zgc:113184 n=1 Tax=Erpetoichthys calabaricus TaxID=27687 RepID=UPI0010A01C99|nr:uncharacterized protein zgc:113184 [Erpetoichthys calabaricus]